MSNKIGRFEIVSEIAHSGTSSVYKASDSETKQTVALKAVRLEPLGEQAATLVKTILQEAESSKVLNSHNIAQLYGAGEMDGYLCASMEYVQGNSIATMLARKEGFSIWDLKDIARQSCQGLDHAHVHKTVHYSLEPAKIMVQWDGIVKILSFGVSGMGALASQASEAVPTLHYMSPEQLRGDVIDARSNLFSLGAILYEMVTERKAFNGETGDQVRQAILEVMPTAVDQVNRKINPALSGVIMKALAKDPAERYQSGQDLVNDLEKCKESGAKVTVGAVPASMQAEQKAASKPPVKATPTPAASAPAPVKKVTPTAPPAAAKAAAASAGWSGADATVNSPRTPKLDPSAQFISNCVKATVDSVSEEQPQMSAAVVDEPATTKLPKISVDPMMDEGRQAGARGKSFSDIDELPPLKEAYVAPEQPSQPPQVEEEEEPAASEPAKAVVFNPASMKKAKVPASDVAKRAVSEIKKTPPQLFVYSVAGAIVVALIIVAGIAFHIHSEDSDDDNTPTATTPAATASATPTPTPAPVAAQPAPPETTPVQVTPPPPDEPAPAVSITPKYSKGNKKKPRVPPAAPSIIPGQLSVDSNPPGAQIQIDGQNTSMATPFSLSSLAPGQHTLVISKPGYASETRTIDAVSGGKSMISVQLAPLQATISVVSDPAGAAVWIDGKDTGRTTPAQIPVDKPGNHSFVFKKQGFLDESTTANLQTGQTVHLSSTLRPLGNTDDIKIGGKFKKMFGGSETAGMGTVSVKTQPKGAQIAVNNRIIDRLSPVEFYLNPGNYEIDITMSGFKSLHKVITVEKNGKVSVEENLDRE